MLFRSVHRMSIDSKIAEIMEESKIAGLINENEESVEEVVEEVPAEEEVVEEEIVEEGLKVDVSADVAALINGESLSEEFKTKAATIFESAVVVRVKEEVARLEEEFESKLAEQVDEITEGLVEKIDGYLDYVVEQIGRAHV